MNSNRNDDDDDSSNAAGPRIPRGVLKTRGGWKGEEMELQHQRETENGDEDDDDDHHLPHRESVVAVDLNQFRNTEVGKGYQAKHVIRQRGRDDDQQKLNIKDMTKPTKEESTKKRHKKNSDEILEQEKDHGKSNKRKRLEKYLKCEAFRKFRKELEEVKS